jgi:plastocyanin
MVVMHARLTVALFAAGAATSVALAACGGSSTHTGASTSVSKPPSHSSVAATATGSSSQPQAAQQITIKNFGYQVPSSVKAGSTVMVKNDDSVAHTVTADSGHAFDVTIQPGATAHFSAPGRSGTYKFHCTFHANMHGTLTVG